MNEPLVDAIIFAKRGDTLLFDSLLNVIEALEGKIRHAFPPEIVIASLSTENVKKLRTNDDVGYLATDRIDELPVPFSTSEFRDIISIWNKQVGISREPGVSDPADKDLSWDAPGYLPPDPPLNIRKMMDDWESDYEKLEDSNE